jgi:Omp85 superfamily domain
MAKNYLGSPLLPKIIPIALFLSCFGLPSWAVPDATNPTSTHIDRGSVKTAKLEAVDQDSLDLIEDNATISRDSIVDGKKQYEYVANPILQMLTWPLDKVVAPGIKLALYPTKPPLRYFLNENVIDRTIGLISFGESDKVMLYPTMNLAPGTGSNTGITLRHKALFGRPTEKLLATGSLYVNGDWKFRSYIVASKLLGTEISAKAALQLIRVKNTTLSQPDSNVAWYYADTANTLSLTLYHRLIEKLGIKGSFLYRDNHFGEAPPQANKIISDFFKNEAGVIDPTLRGLNQTWTDKTFSIGLFRDTRNNENIPLTGSTFDASYHYHATDAKHDFHGWEGTLSSYFKLGKEKYEISSEEERKSGDLSVKAILKRMEYEKIRQGLFNRKVLVTHLFIAQVYELPGNHMPVYGLRTLGNDTPMRGYGGSRFRDYAILSASAEYRFPIMRLVDGVFFNEYGIFDRSLDQINDFDRLRNSWGFGIRVRRPDIYLFRAQLGFHGSHGIQLNMSVDEPF